MYFSKVNVAFCRPVRRLRRWKGPIGQYIVPVETIQNLNPTSSPQKVYDILASRMPQHCCSRNSQGDTSIIMSGIVFELDPLNPESLASQMISKQLRHEGDLITFHESNLSTSTYRHSSCHRKKYGISTGALVSFPNSSTDQ